MNAIKEYVERKELDLKDREREIQASLEFLKEKDNLIAKKEAEIEEVTKKEFICEGRRRKLKVE